MAGGKSADLSSREPPPRIVVVVFDLDLWHGKEAHHRSTELRVPERRQSCSRAPESTATGEDLRLHKTPSRPRHLLHRAASRPPTPP